MADSLSWSLGLATYERLDMLMRNISLSLGQTYPPLEIVIVDSSDNWLEHRRTVLDAFGDNELGIPISYLEARARSSSAQRNQVVEQCKGDVLFLLDDDSLMYPQCAEEIMKVYAADTYNEVVGVAAVDHPNSPDNLRSCTPPEPRIGSKDIGGVSGLLRSILGADAITIPHDEEWPNLRIPESVCHLNVRPNIGMAGCYMTVRRQMALAEPFEEMLGRYAAGEDIDACNRWQRHGCILRALDAPLHHAKAPTGRLGLYYVSAIQGLNRIVLNKLHGTAPERSIVRMRKLYFRLLIIQFLKDLRDLNFRFPRLRGTFFAARRISQIYSMSEQEVRLWYPTIQDTLFKRYGS